MLPVLGLCGVSSVLAWRKARSINRYLAAKRQEFDRGSPHPPAYRLLAAMNPAGAPQLQAAPVGTSGAPTPTTDPPPPSPHQPLLDRLRKLATIRAANALSDNEFRARKIDILSDAASGIARDDIDDLLYELLPLLHEGILYDEDIEFIKQLGDS
jgi:hypothetical protein